MPDAAPPLRLEAAPDPRRWIVVALAAFLFVVSQFYRVANAVVAPELQRDLGLSSEALGAVSAAFFYAFAAAQVPLAAVLDRAGARRIMAGLTVAGAVGAVVFASARGAAGATVGRALLGLGMAGNLMGTLKLVSRWFPPRQFATVAGLVLAVGTFGNILAATPLVLLVEALGWRRSFVVIAAGTALVAAAFFLVVRDAPRGAEPDAHPAPHDPAAASLGSRARLLLGSRDYWLISLGAFTRYGTFAAIQGLWVGPWLVDVLRLSPVAAANQILLMNVALVVGAPLGGWLSDRVLASRKRLALLCLAGLAVAELALAVLGRGTPLWIVTLALVALGVASSFGQVLYAHVKDVMPERMAGMAMTGVNFFVMLGAATFLHVMGWILDRSAVAGARTPEGYQQAFVLAGVSCALSLVAYLATRDARPAPGAAGAPTGAHRL